MMVSSAAGCFSYFDYYPCCHLRVTAAHPLATPQQPQPSVCLWKALYSGRSTSPCLALGEREFSQPSCSPGSSCQCGSEGFVASGSLLHILCQREWCDLARTSLFCNKCCRRPTPNLQFFCSCFSGLLGGILSKKSDTDLIHPADNFACFSLEVPFLFLVLCISGWPLRAVLSVPGAGVRSPHLWVNSPEFRSEEGT